jgi:hypothetical protein
MQRAPFDKAELSFLLYAIGMESPTAWQLMPQLCDALGIEYPPQHIQPTNEQRELMQDPFELH